MKSINLSLLLVLSLLACDPSSQATAQEPSMVAAAVQDESAMTTEEIRVEGMVCKACEYKIKTALGKMAGVKEVTASRKKSKVVVKFDKQKISLDDIKAAITKLPDSSFIVK